MGENISLLLEWLEQAEKNNLKEILFCTTHHRFYEDLINQTEKRIYDRSHARKFHFDKYNFLSLANGEKPERISFSNQFGRCFAVENFLSEAECQYLIKTTSNIGYESIAWEYTPSYRNCKRIGQISHTY